VRPTRKPQATRPDLATVERHSLTPSHVGESSGDERRGRRTRLVGVGASDDYGPTDNEFSGSVLGVQIDLGEDAGGADHLTTPEERLRVAMARQ